VPLPNAEPIGLPAPAWILQVLLVLTFSLHLVPMTLTVGSSLLAVYSEILGRISGGAHHKRLAKQLWSMLPSVTSFTITLGVAPLLFIQLVYGKFFYPASVLTGRSWFAVVPILLLGYGMLYLQAMGPQVAWWRPWAGLAAVLSFFGVAAIYVSTMGLTTEPGTWMQLYRESQTGTHFLFNLPRYLHVALGALAMAGGLTALLGHLAADDAAYSRFARTTGLVLLTAAAVAEVPVALWYRSTLPAEGAAAVQTWILVAAGGTAVLGYALFLSGGARGRKPLLAWLGMACLTATAIFLAVQRHLVRQAIMSPQITAADWKLAPQWDVFAIFAVLLVGTLGLIAFLVARFLKESRQQESKLARSAD
jgi:hypothetical protein